MPLKHIHKQLCDSPANTIAGNKQQTSTLKFAEAHLHRQNQTATCLITK